MTIKYHFFGKEIQISRQLDNRESLNKNLLQQGFTTNHTLLLNQIHSDKVCVVDHKNKIHANQNLPKADAIVTNQPNINIGIVTADCAPILLYCAKTNIIAATHAGWRGAKSGIIENTISQMQQLGAITINAIIGPMIQQPSYEVSKDFYDSFLEESPTNIRFFTPGKSPNKFQFDLNIYVEQKLKSANISTITNPQTDTYQNSQQYFSYRRSTHQNQPDCGRNISIITIK